MACPSRPRLLLAMLALLGTACSEPAAGVAELRHYPLSSLDQLITRSGVEIDRDVSSDGDGSLRIHATSPTTVRLFETGEIDVEAAKLIYRARLRTQDVKGKVYLEMWCHFPTGEFFSRAVHDALSGTVEWATQETSFFLQRGQNPDNVKLNLVIEGTGTVWIDDVRLVRAPLP